MSRLSLEVTESAVAAAPDEIEAALGTLAAAGFKLSVDDFGTGLSSFSRLRHLPVSELKLDRALLADEADTRGRAVLRSLVELGATLGLVVVSEGVEDATTHAWLASIGCPVVQGYFVSRPVSAASLPERVAAIETLHAAPLPLPAAA
jgi:EAL domain-containing protein (putative c-di-GMP-specific phosphodiesterase class I)